jgi:hypothetical protein
MNQRPIVRLTARLVDAMTNGILPSCSQLVFAEVAASTNVQWMGRLSVEGSKHLNYFVDVTARA